MSLADELRELRGSAPLERENRALDLYKDMIDFLASQEEMWEAVWDDARRDARQLRSTTRVFECSPTSAIAGPHIFPFVKGASCADSPWKCTHDDVTHAWNTCIFLLTNDHTGAMAAIAIAAWIKRKTHANVRFQPGRAGEGFVFDMDY